MIRKFTSTGMKLIHHPEVVKKLKDERRASPISLQVAPTSRCNLNCVFCSNANRTKHEDLDVRELFQLLAHMKNRGLKTVEWTGGGDPTLYKHINEAIDFVHKLGLEQGFITNGVLLREKLSEESIKALKWIRVSVNSLEYVPELDLPFFSGTLGFSYVKNEKSTSEVMERIHDHVLRYRPKYVRIVTNCLATDEEQIENNKVYAAEVAELGHPYFYQPKVFERSRRCYWCYIKPFVLHNGLVYPCSSVVLNNDAGRKFNTKYQWATISGFGKKYISEIKPYRTHNCSHCVFTNQNRLIDSIVNPDGMEDFV